MSLLLEALKKAELAKQAAKEPPPAAGNPPFTRDQLPDISQPMEIHSEDLRRAEPEAPAKRVGKPVLELAPEEPPRAAPALQSAAPAMRAAAVETDYSTPGETAERKQARQLFEAKELDVNPRKPFYLTVGALGLFALGTVGYFWYQMQPKNNYKIPPPSTQPAPPVAAAPPAATAPPAGTAPPAAAVTSATEPATPAAATVTPPVGTQPAPPAASAPPAAASAAPAARRGTGPARATAPTTGPVAAAAPQSRPAAREGAIRITPARVQSDPVLEAAYQAYNAGDLATARGDYQQALRANPDNRDALLGLAAVEMQAKRYGAAESFYTRLLELDPRDAYAHAGIIGLHGQVDPLAAESRLKNMIAAQPDASFLNFTLGNQYAAQGRWSEAQQAYFQAYSGDPEHPDFAFNLAISLDRMHQSKPALEYYRRALVLSENHPVSFDKAQVAKRVAQLER